jgi:uncharacterized membrane protein
MIGRFWMKKPPKDINGVYGYRTARSMKSKESWDYAHKYFGRVWYISGIFMAIFSFIAMLIFINNYESASILILITQCIIICLSILPTELSLKKHFDRNGRPITKTDQRTY